MRKKHNNVFIILLFVLFLQVTGFAYGESFYLKVAASSVEELQKNEQSIIDIFKGEYPVKVEMASEADQKSGALHALSGLTHEFSLEVNISEQESGFNLVLTRGEKNSGLTCLEGQQKPMYNFSLETYHQADFFRQGNPLVNFRCFLSKVYEHKSHKSMINASFHLISSGEQTKLRQDYPDLYYYALHTTVDY